MTSEHIIEVNESEFQQEVLAYSSQVPVIVDFWAEWCIPCRSLSPILEKIAEESQGAFRLAKLNVDDNPRIAKHYIISSIPAIKAFQGGQVVAEFTGLRSEPEVREFLMALSPSASDLAIEKGNSLYFDAQWEAAAGAFRESLRSNPDQAEALLGLAKSELAVGNQTIALAILSEFPASKQYGNAEKLQPLAKAMANAEMEEIDSTELEQLDSAYYNSLKLVGRGNILAAIDGLMDVMRADKRFRKGAARGALLGALEMLDPDGEDVRVYRQELASILF